LRFDLSSFNKFMAASGAGYIDFTLASGHAKLHQALRAAKYFMVFIFFLIFAEPRGK
jgi:hypothetical protein